MLRNVGVNRHHENPTVLVDTNSLRARDRKSTRLNSSHDQISYAVFCLKKKKRAPLARDSCYGVAFRPGSTAPCPSRAWRSCRAWPRATSVSYMTRRGLHLRRGVLLATA